MKILRRLMGWALAAAFVWFFFRSVLTYADRIGVSGLVPDMAYLIEALCILFLWLIIYELGSEWILRRACMPECPVRWPRTALVFYRSFLLRYVPGKVWTVLVRVEGLADVIPRAIMLRCVVYEQAHLNAATVIIAILALPFVLDHGGRLQGYAIGGSLLLAAIGLGVFLFFPKPMCQFVNRIASSLTRNRVVEVFKLEGGFREWYGAFFIFALVVVLQALALVPLTWALVPDAGALRSEQWLVLLGMYPVARLIGQMSMVAPAGLGVREGAYVILVLPVLDATLSPTLVAWARLLSVVPELVLYLAFKAIQPRSGINS